MGKISCHAAHHQTEALHVSKPRVQALHLCCRAVSRDRLNLQRQRDRLRVIAQDGEDFMKAAEAKEEQALQRCAALEAKNDESMKRLADVFETDRATIKAFEESAVCFATLAPFFC